MKRFIGVLHIDSEGVQVFCDWQITMHHVGAIAITLPPAWGRNGEMAWMISSDDIEPSDGIVVPSYPELGLDDFFADDVISKSGWLKDVSRFSLN